MLARLALSVCLFFSLTTGRIVENVQFELLYVEETVDPTDLISLLTKAWYTNYFSDTTVDGVSKIKVSFDLLSQDTTSSVSSNILTFQVDLTYDSDQIIDEAELLRLPFNDMKWVYGYSRSLRLSGGSLSDFVGPVSLLSAGGTTFQAPQNVATIMRMDDNREGALPRSSFDLTIFIFLLAIGAVALLFCYFASILFLRALSSRKL